MKYKQTSSIMSIIANCSPTTIAIYVSTEESYPNNKNYQWSTKKEDPFSSIWGDNDPFALDSKGTLQYIPDRRIWKKPKMVRSITAIKVDGFYWKHLNQIGRASCRERVPPPVEIPVVAGSVRINKHL